MERSRALEATIAADPDGELPTLVYADWLLERGHPLGQLIVRMHADRGQHVEATLAYAAAVGLVPRSFDWRLGFVRAAHFAGDGRGMEAWLADASFRFVEQLGLAETDIADVRPLASLTALRFLDLRATQVADLTPLQALGDLRGLGLSIVPATDFAMLAAWPALRFLDVTMTAFDDGDLALLPRLPHLRELTLAGTQITHLAPLAQLPGLERLFLNSLPALDLSPLVGLERLTYIEVFGQDDAEVGRLVHAREHAYGSDDPLSICGSESYDDDEGLHRMLTHPEPDPEMGRWLATTVPHTPR